MEDLKYWMLSRIWPHRYDELEDALSNFRRVLEDFCNTFDEHAEESRDRFSTKKFYQLNHWNETLHAQLLNDFYFHVDLIEDLVLELTRAANYVCDNVRKFLLPNFMKSEGVLLVTYGPCMDLSFITLRVEYRGQERTRPPYPGIDEFKKIREHRDFHFGEGTAADRPK